jgi:long-chain fatty acid transport protein
MRPTCPWLMAATLATGLLDSSPVYASGIAGARFGGEHGSVVADNPTAIYHNPAGLGFSGTQLFVDLTVGLRVFEWTHARAPGEAAEPSGFEGANYGTARATTVGAGPQLGASVQFGSLVLGAGVYAPYGGATLRFDRNQKLGNSMYPAAADGVARWHGYEASGAHVFSTLGAALRFGALSIGASGNLIFSSYAVSRAINTPSDGNDLTREQRAYVSAKAIHGSFGLGAMWEAMPSKLWLGVSYQAQPGLGELRIDGRYELDPTPGISDETRKQRITLHDALPDVIRLGGRYRPSNILELRLYSEFTRWSVRGTTCVGVQNKPCTVNADGSAAPGSGVIKSMREDWRDTLSVHAGASYWVVPALELFVGVGYEPAAIPDATLTPLLADANNLTGALGARVAIARTWFVGASYSHKYFFPRDNTGRSQLADPAVQITSRAPDGGGTYEQWLALISVNVTKVFAN